jgi:ribonuclease HI
MVAQIYGKSLLLDKLAITSICTDACRIGTVVYYQDDWFYANWVVDFPFANNLHINELEAFSVVLETLRWAKQWRNKRVIIFSDNRATVTCLNKGTSKNRTLNVLP